MPDVEVFLKERKLPKKGTGTKNIRLKPKCLLM